VKTPLLVLFGNAILWAIVAQLNHYLSAWDVSVFAGGLCVAFAALRFSPRDGYRALLLTGLWFDAAAPVPFGLHALLFLFAHAVINSFRTRIATEDSLIGLLVAAIANLALIVALSIGLLHRNPALWELWPRVTVDSLISFCAVILLGPWYFATQEHLLAFFGAPLRREARTFH
jgi:cell shape-determining protein MreD